MQELEDTYRHKGMRRQLIEQLRSKGIQDETILEAMDALPRHFFLDRAFEEWAYQDKAFPIGHDQTISQPFTVAYMTQLLEVQKRMTVLEIGTGSGYQAALIASLGGRVFSIERQKSLYQKTVKLLRRLGFERIRVFLRDGYEGLPEFAPFDRIIVTAAAPEVPEALKAQLKIGGIMVVPVGKGSQKMYRITRISESDYELEVFGDFQFVPMLQGVIK